MPYREAADEAPCHECDVRTAAGVGCLRCDLVLCERHRPAADARCAACEREWEHDRRKLERGIADYEQQRERSFVVRGENGAIERNKERWLHRHPIVALGAITALVVTSAAFHHAIPLLAVMFLVQYPVLGRWRDPRAKIPTARRAFLAERHVRLLKTPGGSAG